MSTVTTSKKLTNEIKSVITRAIFDMLNDSDFGLALSNQAKKRLRQIIASKNKIISFDQIKKKYY